MGACCAQVGVTQGKGHPHCGTRHHSSSAPASFPADEMGTSPCQPCNSPVKKRVWCQKHARAPSPVHRQPKRSPEPGSLLQFPPASPDTFKFSSSSVSSCASQAGSQNFCSPAHPLERGCQPWVSAGCQEGPMPWPCSPWLPPQHCDAPHLWLPQPLP